MRVGILGGSFNPVHAGHLALATAAYSELNLDQLHFVPSFQNPLKESRALLPADTLLKLLRKALKPYPFFSLSTCEIDRKGKSYTIDTLRYFRKKSGKDAKLYFVTGMDSLETLPRWKSVAEIFKQCHFVVAARPGYRWKETKYPVMRMPFDALAISSSQIRKKTKGGLTSKRVKSSN